jgi:hypothetical protein
LGIIGIAYLVLVYGLWKGKGWAWKTILILTGLSIILEIVSIAAGNIEVLSLFTMILEVLDFCLLLRPSTKEYFGI